jgi:hypothetical protein
MEKGQERRLVIICITVTGTAQVRDYLQYAQAKFQGCSNENFVQVDDNMFLVDLDACYPAVIKLIEYCNQSSSVRGQPAARLLIAELSGSPLTLSPDHQGVLELAQKMGLQVRLTKFPPAEQRPVRA